MNRLILVVFILALAVVPLLGATPEFWVTQLNYIGLASLVVLGLVLLTGVGGLTSFGQAAFVAAFWPLLALGYDCLGPVVVLPVR